MTTERRQAPAASPTASLIRDLVRRVGPLLPADGGWATGTLEGAMGGAFLLGTAGWQLVMLGAIVASPVPASLFLPLASAHAAVLVVTLAAHFRRLPKWPATAAVPALFLADWTASESMEDPLLFAACWMINLATATATVVLHGRCALMLPLVAALAIPLAMVVLRPDLPMTLPVAVLGAQLAILIATRIGQSYLYDLAARADDEAAAAQREASAAATQEAASHAAAEDARVLHDTVINTLAALASGGAAVSDIDAVRERCTRDITTVAALRSGAAPATDSRGIRAELYDTRVQVRHRGLSDNELSLAEAALTPARRRALRLVVSELVQNAAKHARVDEVEVRAEQRQGVLVVTVADQGVGFDGRVGAGGLATSVLARAKEAGIDVDLDTVPGAGTRVALTVPTAANLPGRMELRDRHGSDSDIGSVVRVLRRRACLVYASGVAAIGFLLAITNHRGQATPEYVMAALAALGVALASRITRRRDALPWWAVGALVVAAATAFVASAAAVGYGREDPVLWQAVGATGLLVLIAELGPRPTTVLWAAGAYAVVVVVVAIVTDRASDRAETIVLTAGGAGLGLLAGWSRFQRAVGTIAARAAADQRSAWASRTRIAEREAAERSRDRWRNAGLDRALELLETARRTDDPGEPTLRLSCAYEEAYLRQLTLLHPDLVHLGEWFARALNNAHDGGVRLVIRSSGSDLPADVAADLGDLVLAAVAGTPSGADLTVTLFPDLSGARMTLVGAHPHLQTGLRSATGPLGAAARVQSVGNQDVAEVLIAVPA